MSGGSSPPLLLRGRRSECEALDRLLAGVRTGQSQVLVLRGEAGVGKTALLEYLAARAGGCRIARAAGAEFEMELAFAALHQLCGSMLDRIDGLPAPQRDALRTAFGLSGGGAPDRFLTGLAVLGVLSQESEQRPVVCIVDDAQWLDRASAEALAFVARRVLAEPLGLVFVVREPSDVKELVGLPEIVVEGLDGPDAFAVLDSAIRGPMDERVRERIVAETRGNPLALLELSHGSTPVELAGGFGLPDKLALAPRIERSFVRRVQALPEEAQRLLLVAAAEPVGDVTLLWRAAEQLRIPPEAAWPAVAAELIEFGVRVRFRHPLVRSAAYRAAVPPDRREAHRVLAEVTDPALEPDRRAWHRAHAAVGPDEAVARDLERSAGRAQRRGGVAAAAAFLERASELTPDPARRAGRALAAAQAKFDAGAVDSASALLAAADPAQLDQLQRARRARLRAQITFVRTRGAGAPRQLLEAAGSLDPVSPALAREAYLEALRAAIFAGRLVEGSSVQALAETVRAAPPAEPPPSAMDLLLDGLAIRFTAGYAAAAQPLRWALDAFWHDGRPVAGEMRWLWLACPVAPEPIAPDLWDDETWDRLTGRAVTLAREAGALTVLPIALTARAGVHVHAGEFSTAEALVEEADEISTATGNAPLPYTSLLVAAWRGDKTKAQELIESAFRDATTRGEGRAIGLAEHASAVLHNGLGQYPVALAAAQRACEHEDLGFFGWSLSELIEAATRAGAPDDAAAALAQLEARTSAAGTSWALGMQARSRALLSDGEEADALYREAIERLDRTRVRGHLARAHLLYGEWLRRGNRRVTARQQLRAAYEMFSDFGAEAFAERARRELLATGETVRRLTTETRDVLTPQEGQIARLAAAGRTNPEIGAQLFISPRTVEYHLRKVFDKLGISSRRGLRAALPDVGAANAAAHP